MPLNALAPQVNAVCLCSTPRPRQRRFRRLSSFGRRSGPQGQFSTDDTTLQERTRTRGVLRPRCVVGPPLRSLHPQGRRLVESPASVNRRAQRDGGTPRGRARPLWRFAHQTRLAWRTSGEQRDGKRRETPGWVWEAIRTVLQAYRAVACLSLPWHTRPAPPRQAEVAGSSPASPTNEKPR